MNSVGEKRTGIFGGSFSPVHKGHINAAVCFKKQFFLDRLYIVPARTPPHKNLDGGASDGDRLAMLKTAFAPYDGITVSDFELKRDAVSYTYDTLTHFLPEGKLFMLCGTDMFLSLDSWHRASDVMKMCTVVCALREKSGDESRIFEKASFYRDKYGASVDFLNYTPVEISSTEVRRIIKSGGDVSEYISAQVGEYITEKRLYL